MREKCQTWRVYSIRIIIKASAKETKAHAVTFTAASTNFTLTQRETFKERTTRIGPRGSLYGHSYYAEGGEIEIESFFYIIFGERKNQWFKTFLGGKYF